MEFLYMLQTGSWIIMAIVICMVIFIISLAGKISPKFSLLLMAIGIGILSLMSSNVDKSTPNSRSTDSSTIPTVDTTLAEQASELETNRNEEAQGNPTSNPDRHRTKEKERVPEAYGMVDSQFRTYRAEGNWEWSPAFVEALAQKTGWKKSKNGNFTISIDYLESYTQNTVQQTRVFVNTGGEIEIKVNGDLCCCNGRLVIPAELAAASMNEMQLLLQKTVTELIKQHQHSIIPEIQKCL